MSHPNAVTGGLTWSEPAETRSSQDIDNFDFIDQQHIIIVNFTAILESETIESYQRQNGIW